MVSVMVEKWLLGSMPMVSRLCRLTFWHGNLENLYNTIVISWCKRYFALGLTSTLCHVSWCHKQMKTHRFNKRIISFFNQICQSCSRINNSSPIVRCCKCWLINWQQLPIDWNALQVQIIMRPGIIYVRLVKLLSKMQIFLIIRKLK